MSTMCVTMSDVYGSAQCWNFHRQSGLAQGTHYCPQAHPGIHFAALSSTHTDILPPDELKATHTRGDDDTHINNAGDALIVPHSMRTSLSPWRAHVVCKQIAIPHPIVLPTRSSTLTWATNDDVFFAAPRKPPRTLPVRYQECWALTSLPGCLTAHCCHSTSRHCLELSSALRAP